MDSDIDLSASAPAEERGWERALSLSGLAAILLIIVQLMLH